jgi:hypothetical protein
MERRSNILSLDLETTGLSPTDLIWSVGLANSDSSKNKELFLNGIADRGDNRFTGVAKLFGLHNNSFGTQQLESGSFEAFGKAVEDAKTVNFDTAIGNLIKSMDDTNTLLIQNVNFEDRFINSKISPIQRELLSKKIFAPTPSTKRRLLQEDVSIENARKESRESLNILLSSFKDNSDIENSLLKYSDSSIRLMTTIQESINSAAQSGKVAVVDLMDISRSTYALAAQKGHIDPKFVNIVSNMDYITRSLHGRSEAHTALMDAVDQIHAYNVFTEGYKELLTTGNLTSDMSKLVSNISSGFHEVNYNFLKSIRSHLEDVGTKFTTTEDAAIKAFGNLSYIEDGLNGFGRESFTRHIGTLNKDEALAYVGDALKAVSNNDYSITQRHAASIESKSLEMSLGKKLTIGGGVLFAGLALQSSFGDRSTKRTQDNTFNELYDNQYVGKELADWEQRNNSYRMS